MTNFAKKFVPPMTRLDAIILGTIIGLIPSTLVFLFISIITMNPAWGLFFILFSMSPLTVAGGIAAKKIYSIPGTSLIRLSPLMENPSSSPLLTKTKLAS